MKLQLVAEKLVAVAADAVQRQATPEETKGPWNHMLGGKGLRCDATAVDAGRNDGDNPTR